MVVPAAPFLAILSQRPGESAWWAASHASHASVDPKLITGSASVGMRAVNHERPTARSATRMPGRARVGVQNPHVAGAVLDPAVVSCIFASVRTAADD